MHATVSNVATHPLTGAAAGPTVLVDGCIVDAGYLPRSTSIHALTTTGQLLATAHADERGAFRMQVPAKVTLRLVLGTPSAQARAAMDVQTRSDDVHLEACVIDLSPAR